MTNKLNLTIDEEVIKRTKQYSKLNNVSISKLVQSYLDKLTASQKTAQINILEKYKGLLNGKLSDADVAKIIEEKTRQKYGN